MAHKLLPGSQLLPKQFLESKNGRYRLTYQSDGNLVIQDFSVPGGRPVWDSHTHGSTPGALKMQEDGNLVLYNRSGAAIWSTETCHPHQRGICASLQDNGYLVVHTVSTGWSSALPHPHRIPAVAGTSNGVGVGAVSDAGTDTVQLAVNLL